MAAPQLILASRSPTRLRVLRQAGVHPLVLPSDVDETVGDLELSVAVSELALRKASAIAGEHHDDLVLGCDSLVELDGQVLGKPGSAEEAAEWWRTMRRRSVTVWTGHALMLGGRVQLRSPSAVVHIGAPSDAEIDRYAATDEPLGAAGGFRLDGRAAAFITGIEGDPGTVHGVSIPALHDMLADLDVELTDLWA
jgi:septum formation protein